VTEGIIDIHLLYHQVNAYAAYAVTRTISSKEATALIAHYEETSLSHTPSVRLLYARSQYANHLIPPRQKLLFRRAAYSIKSTYLRVAILQENSYSPSQLYRAASLYRVFTPSTPRPRINANTRFTLEFSQVQVNVNRSSNPAYIQYIPRPTLHTSIAGNPAYALIYASLSLGTRFAHARHKRLTEIMTLGHRWEGSVWPSIRVRLWNNHMVVRDPHGSMLLY
jgi:hypothetical protein